MDSNEENQSFSNFSQQAQDDINRAINREKLISEIENDLKNNPRYKSFFDQYHPRSVNSFINDYKHNKMLWSMWGSLYESIEQKKILKYSGIAYNKLWEIQQKKLFNLQCQWRAENIELPGIQTSHDFLYWEQFIKQCTLIPPVTENEFDLYLEYILSDDFEIDDSYNYTWQNYDDFKAEYNDTGDESSMPGWYEFYDSRMGTGTLLTLPDIRGDKENFYINLFFENDKIENPQKWAPKQDPDNRPQLVYYDNDVIEQFIETFEDIKIKDAYRAMKNGDLNNFNYDDSLIEAIDILKQDKDTELTLAGNWRDSILQTARNYEKQKVYQAFPIAYNNYLKRINMGIGFNHELSDDSILHINQIVKNYKDKILKGRLLNNEPEDFNF